MSVAVATEKTITRKVKAVVKKKNSEEIMEEKIYRRRGSDKRNEEKSKKRERERDLEMNRVIENLGLYIYIRI